MTVEIDRTYCLCKGYTLHDFQLSVVIQATYCLVLDIGDFHLYKWILGINIHLYEWQKRKGYVHVKINRILMIELKTPFAFFFNMIAKFWNLSECQQPLN